MSKICSIIGVPQENLSAAKSAKNRVESAGYNSPFVGLTIPGRGRVAGKVCALNDNRAADDRRKLLAFARDLLNSDYAGHRLSLVQFAPAPHFNHLNAVYNAFDFSGPLEFVKKAVGLSDGVGGEAD
jgi:4-hydroxyphenylacetate 3-hydroxylase C terminal